MTSPPTKGVGGGPLKGDMMLQTGRTLFSEEMITKTYLNYVALSLKMK